MNATQLTRTTLTMSVFLYHAVVSERPKRLRWNERKYWMDVADFRRHLEILAGSAHRVVPLEDGWRARTFPPLLPSLLETMPEPTPAVLTFDDGWESDFSVVWPLVREARFPATFFVNTATLGTPGHLRWSAVRQMSAEGASFQSHGHRHADLTRLTARDLLTELRMSKDLLEGWTRKPVEFLAVPYGRVNRTVVDAAREAGFRAVCTSDPRPAFPGAARVGRVAIHARTKPGELVRLMERRRIPYWARGAHAALLAPAKLLVRPPAPKRKLLPETVR